MTHKPEHRKGAMRFMEQAAQRIWVLIVFLSVLAVSVSQAVAGCLEDTRSVQMDKHHARLRSFLCSSDDDHQALPLVRVEFHRLSDAAATMFFLGMEATHTRNTFGEGLIIKNDIYDVFRQLASQFSEKATGENLYYSFSIETPKSGGAIGLHDERVPYSYLLTTGRAYDMNVPHGISLDVLIAKWNAYYSYSENNSYTPITFWKYPARAELTSGLQKHLISSSCPQDLATIVHTVCNPDPNAGCQECGTRLAERLVVADVALFENISGKQIIIDRLHGDSTNAPVCRIVSAPTTSGSAPIWAQSIVLGAGERVFVPLKITFIASEHVRQMANNAKRARYAYERFRSLPPGTLIDTGNGVKVRNDLLRPPRTPLANDYVYGPEWRLRALDVNERRVTLAKKSANFLNLTVSSDGASCPYLLAWDTTTDRWTEFGKILHVARSKETEQAHTTRISGFRSKFRLAERELEVAYIDHAELLAELKDGRTLILTASEPRLANRDGQYAVLRMGEVADFEFKLPDNVNESDVSKSKLTVFGYYEPIASLVRK